MASTSGSGLPGHTHAHHAPILASTQGNPRPTQQVSQRSAAGPGRSLFQALTGPGEQVREDKRVVEQLLSHEMETFPRRILPLIAFS